MSSPSSDADRSLPAVDERLVAPGSGYEIDDGRLVRVSPCDPPHGIRHSKLAAMLEVHVAPEFQVALDMLTRTSETSDIAPDASVFPIAPDPTTGGRQLEHLAFEVVSTQTLAYAAGKASQLVRRGVRRVFAIDLNKSSVFEWSTELGTWMMLEADANISDLALAVPLPVATLAGSVNPDDAIANALLAKGNARFEEALAVRERLARAGALVTILEGRGLWPRPDQRAQIYSERDPQRLQRWLGHVTACASIGELLAIP